MSHQPVRNAIIVVIIVILGGLYFYFDRQSPMPNTPGQNSNAPAPTGSSEPSSPSPEASGLKVETLFPGSGSAAKAGNTITVNYTGMFTNGTVFDSSVPRGQPFQFTLGSRQVIQGWDLGLVGMKVGEKRKLTIPPELGYGPAGSGPIPPNTTLIFDVELLKIE